MSLRAVPDTVLRRTLRAHGVVGNPFRPSLMTVWIEDRYRSRNRVANDAEELYFHGWAGERHHGPVPQSARYSRRRTAMNFGRLSEGRCCIIRSAGKGPGNTCVADKRLPNRFCFSAVTGDSLQR